MATLRLQHSVLEVGLAHRKEIEILDRLGARPHQLGHGKSLRKREANILERRIELRGRRGLRFACAINIVRRARVLTLAALYELGIKSHWAGTIGDIAHMRTASTARCESNSRLHAESIQCRDVGRRKSLGRVNSADQTGAPPTSSHDLSARNGGRGRCGIPSQEWSNAAYASRDPDRVGRNSRSRGDSGLD